MHNEKLLVNKVKVIEDLLHEAIKEGSVNCNELNEYQMVAVHLASISSLLTTYLNTVLKGQDKLTALENFYHSVYSEITQHNEEKITH